MSPTPTSSSERATAPAGRLEQLLAGSPYQQYLYGYPHKTAYRPLAPPRRLERVWAEVPKDALFLYVHVPFCELRCGFCNLFAAANPVEDVVDRYVTAMEREAEAARRALGPASFVRAAIGGGTPSFLPVRQLARVFDLMERTLGAPLGRIPLCIEVSPETTTAERVALIHERGADRVSIGVQSFVPDEVAALRRPQQNADVARALELIRARDFATLNVDLIYGIEGQTERTLELSLRETMRWAPEELYLYPLYVRPLTLLGKSPRAWDDHRLALYRAGRAWLLGNGYEQVSMRMFRRKPSAGRVPSRLLGEGRHDEHSPLSRASPSWGEGQGEGFRAPVYRCQEDGMVGVGCGARSYAGATHYSQEWAVASRAVRGIIDSYSLRPAASFELAHHGFELDGEDLRRRYAILSLLADGLEGAKWTERFGTGLWDDLPQLAELEALGLARRVGDRLVLTPEGVERSDVIGPWLHSERVDALMRQWEAR